MGSNEALLDASAFLELEKGMPDQHMDGVEAAVLQASAPVSTSPTNGASAQQQQPQPAMRINKASLDRIAAAAKNGSMTTFGLMREDTLLAMDAVRASQVSIFHEHMRFDVFDTQEDLDLSSKDFLTNFQTAHLAKEKNMNAITKSLETLSNQLGELNKKTGAVNAIPGDPLSTEKQVVGLKMSLKSAAQKVIEHNKVKGSRLNYIITDAQMMHKIQHGSMESSAGTTGGASSGAVDVTSSTTTTNAGESGVRSSGVQSYQPEI